MNLYPEKTAEVIDAKIAQAFHAIFEDEETRFYFEGPDADCGYMMDTGNLDARTEGMSYGMMMAVQMDRQDLFDRLWSFSLRYMLHKEGPYEGYFAWSVKPDGTHNAEGPAPDGEEYFAMALFFAEQRWGGRDAPYDYGNQARTILRHCVHQEEMVPEGRAMWNREHMIRFIPEADFSDPSYHLPHFYLLFARWADEADRAFWSEAASQSRKYLSKTCHPKTGMASEYADEQGKPMHLFGKEIEFYSDAYRVAMNIGLDSAWNGENREEKTIAEHLQAFLLDHPELMQEKTCMIQGDSVDIPVQHPLGLLATTAAASLSCPDSPVRRVWLERFWAAEPRTGNRRYYDNCLYFFSLLMLTGRYRIWEKKKA